MKQVLSEVEERIFLVELGMTNEESIEENEPKRPSSIYFTHFFGMFFLLLRMEWKIPRKDMPADFAWGADEANHLPERVVQVHLCIVHYSSQVSSDAANLGSLRHSKNDPAAPALQNHPSYFPRSGIPA